MIKSAAFIDGANFYATVKMLSFDVDFSKFKVLFDDRSLEYMVRINYYTALLDESNGNNSLRPLVDWLSFNGYNLVTKDAKEFTDASGKRKVKGNMDVEMAVDMLELASVVDHMYLFSGDGDFTSVVKAVQRKGVRVTVVSSLKTLTPGGQSSPIISDELRRQADAFIDLHDFKAKLRRT